jgi:hypothetical protein
MGSFDHDRGEKDMSDDLVTVLSHQRQMVGTRRPQRIDQNCLGTSFEGGEVDGVDGGVVLGLFGSDGDHLVLPGDATPQSDADSGADSDAYPAPWVGGRNS